MDFLALSCLKKVYSIWSISLSSAVSFRRPSRRKIPDKGRSTGSGDILFDRSGYGEQHGVLLQRSSPVGWCPVCLEVFGYPLPAEGTRFLRHHLPALEDRPQYGLSPRKDRHINPRRTSGSRFGLFEEGWPEQKKAGLLPPHLQCIRRRPDPVVWKHMGTISHFTLALDSFFLKVY